MFRNYFITAYRFFNRNKTYSLINIFSLSVALAIAFIICMHLINEFGYNSHIANKEQIFRVYRYNDALKMNFSTTPVPLSNAIKESLSKIKYATGYRNVRNVKFLLQGNYIPIRSVISSNEDILRIFSFPLKFGSYKGALAPNSIVLSSKQAELFFPGENPVGQTVEGIVHDKQYSFKVSAVLDEQPENSSFLFDCILDESFLTVEANSLNSKTVDLNSDWKRDFVNSYILVNQDCEIEQLNKEFFLAKKKYSSIPLDDEYRVQPLNDRYLNRMQILNTGKTADIKTLNILIVVGILLLVVATSNYVILSTSLSQNRTKEIGIRKSNGASVGDIRRQLLWESMGLSLCVLPFSIILAFISLPYVDFFINSKINIISNNVAQYVISFVLLTLLIGFISGFYASVYLSRISISDNFSINKTTGSRKLTLESMLIILQIVIFSSLIASTLLIKDQYKYFMNYEVRFNDKNLLNVEIDKDYYSVFKNKILQYPEIISLSGSLFEVPSNNATYININKMPNNEKINCEVISADYDFVETLGLKIKVGRSFSKTFPSDQKYSTVVNEALVKQLGIENPIGYKLSNGKVIVGVVEDFHFHSLHKIVPPLLIFLNDKYTQTVLIRYAEGSLDKLISILEAEYKLLNPKTHFRYSLIEDNISAFYRDEKRMIYIVTIASFFSVLIAVAGLFGLVLFVTRKKLKEFGIRKVLGCNKGEIIILYLKKFIWYVIIGVLLSFPITIFVINKWLENYAYKGEIDYSVFIISFILSCMVVLISILYHSVKASQIRPSEILKSE